MRDRTLDKMVVVGSKVLGADYDLDLPTTQCSKPMLQHVLQFLGIINVPLDYLDF
jgi:hypothetical protein